MGNIGIWQLVIILVIVLLLFGTKKIANIGGDLGSAIRNFRKSVKDGEDESAKRDAAQQDPAKQVPQQNTQADGAKTEANKDKTKV